MSDTLSPIDTYEALAEMAHRQVTELLKLARECHRSGEFARADEVLRDAVEADESARRWEQAAHDARLR
jgi:Arc/MetJ-type ribon-helix-helix transcriptional regulator